MGVEVIIPWQGSDPHRMRALGWVTTRLTASLGLEIRLATREGEEWIKAEAFMPAVLSSQADIIVMHDADVYCEGLEEAINKVEGGASWAIPHMDVHRLSEAGTDAFMLGREFNDDLDRPTYMGMAGGGIVVTRRDSMIDIPMDPRFVNWGHEDDAWAIALWAALGVPWRGSWPLVHFWHPPMPRKTRRQGSELSWRLRNEYAQAANDPGRMAALLQQAHDHLRSPHNAGYDYPSSRV